MKKEAEEENQELSNDLILVKYFQFREEEFSARGGIGAHTAETNVLGEILYQFLNDLELSEFDWLIERNKKLKERLPVGFDMQKAKAIQK